MNRCSMEFSNCSVVLNPITVEVNDNKSINFSGCSMKLPNCTVVLNRITDEEINHYCAPGSNTESARKVKAGRKTRKRTRYRKIHKKMRPGKQVHSKTRNTNKLKRGSFSRKTSGFSSDSITDWSLDDETKSESETIKIKLKRRRNPKKVCQANVSSVHNAMETVANVHTSYLSTDDNSIIQSPNLSSKCDFHHHIKTSTFDSSANYLRDEQNNNAGQICSIVPNSKHLYSYSAVEDIPLSTLKNMSELELKNIVSFINSEKQSSVNKKTQPLWRKRNKRLKLSPQNEKSDSGNENCVHLTKNASDIQELEGSGEDIEVDLINPPLSTTIKESEGTFLFDHNSGGLNKSANADWNNGTSLISSKEKNCSSRCHSRIDNLPPINCCSDKGPKSNENEEIEGEKKIESQVKISKKSIPRKYRKKEQKVSLLVKELDEKSEQQTRERRKEKNIKNNATRFFVKTNEPSEKLNRHNSKISKDEAIIVSSKLNQSERFPRPLILKRIVGGYQTVKALDKTISRDTRKGFKINEVNIAHMQKGHYSCRFPKDVKTDRISVTKSNLNNLSAPIEISLCIDKWKLILERKLSNLNYSYNPDQSDMILDLRNQYKLFEGNQSKDEQLKEIFKEKTDDKNLDLTHFTDSQENGHLQDKCQSLQALPSLTEIYKLSNLNKTPERTDTNDDCLSLYNSPPVLSPVQSNYLYTKESFQTKISPFKNLKLSTSPPQSEVKRDFDKTVPCVVKLIKVSTDNYTRISQQNKNTILTCKNNLSPICGLISPSIPHTSSERHHSTKIPTCSKKEKLSDSTSFHFLNTQNSKIKITDVYSLKYPENRDPRLTELYEMVPDRIDNTNETNMPIDKNPCFLSSNVKTRTPEIHLKKVAEPCYKELLKQTCKALENILSAAEILDVITSLAIADLGENPQSHLQAKIGIEEAVLKDLLSRKRITLKSKDRIHSIQNAIYVLNIAELYLIFYGSFSNVSDYFLKDFKSDPVRK